MAIKYLTDEQIRTMTVEEKDRWWLENVYKGDVPQMTVRVVICGFLLGGLLSITNLYVGAKAGWSLGVAITAVILAFVMFKALSKVGLGYNYNVLESNILQSIACAAGYMNGPLIASMAAYMVVTDTVIPWWQMVMWLLGLAVMGVLFAFPLKRRFINDEQLPFPEGRACGVVMDTLHSGEGGAKSALPAKLLVIFSIIAGVLRLFQSHAIMEKLRIGFLTLPELLDEWYYRLAERLGWWMPNIAGTPLRDLTIRPELEFAMIGAGGLMGIRTGVSLMVGAIINYGILVPIMIKRGDIVHTVSDSGFFQVTYPDITKWALWCGVAMMTTASLYSFFAKPQMFVSAFKGLFGKKQKKRNSDPLRLIELPLWVSLVGVPIVGAYLVWMAQSFFGVSYWMGAIAVPMVFIFALIGVNSTALTSITPTGPLGKITQLVYGGIAPGNITTNLATAGITAEVAGNASNLIQNIKPGYMLGAKPRLQAIGHLIGAFSGAIFSVAIFYPLFLRNNPAGLISEEYPYPAAVVWKGVAEILTEGLSQLAATAVWAAGIGAALGIVLEIVRGASKGKFPLTPVGIGLAFVIPFRICLAMFFGSFIFWVIGKLWPKPEQRPNEVFVQNQESICAGVIAGAALIGVGVMALELFVLSE